MAGGTEFFIFVDGLHKGLSVRTGIDADDHTVDQLSDAT